MSELSEILKKLEKKDNELLETMRKENKIVIQSYVKDTKNEWMKGQKQINKNIGKAIKRSVRISGSKVFQMILGMIFITSITSIVARVQTERVITKTEEIKTLTREYQTLQEKAKALDTWGIDFQIWKEGGKVLILPLGMRVDTNIRYLKDTDQTVLTLIEE